MSLKLYHHILGEQCKVCLVSHPATVLSQLQPLSMPNMLCSWTSPGRVCTVKPVNSAGREKDSQLSTTSTFCRSFPVSELISCHCLSLEHFQVVLVRITKRLAQLCPDGLSSLLFYKLGQWIYDAVWGQTGLSELLVMTDCSRPCFSSLRHRSTQRASVRPPSAKPNRKLAR